MHFGDISITSTASESQTHDSRCCWMIQTAPLLVPPQPLCAGLSYRQTYLEFFKASDVLYFFLNVSKSHENTATENDWSHAVALADMVVYFYSIPHPLGTINFRTTFYANQSRSSQIEPVTLLSLKKDRRPVRSRWSQQGEKQQYTDLPEDFRAVPGIKENL